MKKYALYFICFMMVVAATSCKKEKDDSFLKGKMTGFHGQKAYIDNDRYSCFRQGEVIRVNTRNCAISGVSNDARTCNISGAEVASRYYAFYPANMISETDISEGFSEATVTLKRRQLYAVENGHQVIDNPMAGYLPSSNGTIEFNNLCALLKITVFSNCTLDSIVVTCPGAALFGTGKVNATTWKLEMDANQTANDSITLRFPNRRAGKLNGESYYIVVPEATLTVGSDAIQVRIYGTNVVDDANTHVKLFSMTIASGGNNVLAYNKIHNFADFYLGHVDYNSKCVFTVAPNKQVTIAPGNLVVGKEGVSNQQWGFMPNTYDDPELTRRNYYFCYGTSRWSGGVVNYKPEIIPSAPNQYSNYFLGGTYTNDMIGVYADADWGWHNCIEHGPSGNRVTDPPHMWRTPTKAEWDYLLFTRNESYHFAKAAIQVNRNHPDPSYASISEINGLIIFPDGWNGATPGNYDDMNADFPNSAMSQNTWKTTYENNGCVFLPADGYRNVGRDPATLLTPQHAHKAGHYCGQAGFYACADHWAGGSKLYDAAGYTSGTHNEYYYVNCFIFTRRNPQSVAFFNLQNSVGFVGTSYIMRCDGVNVRLVHDIN